METSNNISTVYTSSTSLLFSHLVDGINEKKWKPWSSRILEIRSDSTLVYKHTKETVPTHVLDLKVLNLSAVAIPKDASQVNNNMISKNDPEIGFHCECKENNMYTAFKCIMPASELKIFCTALKKVSHQHNVDHFLSHHHIVSAVKATEVRRTLSINTIEKHKQANSVMRRSIAESLDETVIKNRKEKIVARRGAFKWLPVYFSNDLVHASWWFVAGSLFTVAFPIFIIIGNYNSHLKSLAYDDDVLAQASYDATWVLVIISGAFFTMGSWAFLRAVNDPPMRPIFHNTYHFGTDELLGSWLFVFAVVPYVPYSLIYVVSDPSDGFMYGFAVLSVLAVCGALIFLANCYPSDVSRGMYLVPVLKFLNPNFCCCSQNIVEKHLSNDWLAGTWIMLLVTAFGCCLVFLGAMYEIWKGNSLLIYEDVCSVVDTFMFLVGSAYFVAGSYPETSLSDTLITKPVTTNYVENGEESDDHL